MAYKNKFINRLYTHPSVIPRAITKQMFKVFLSGHTVKLCKPQRGIAIGKSLSHLFFNDIDQNSKAAYRYNFGEIILTKAWNEKSYEIIDGQQRITISMIFLTVMRDLLRELSEDQRSSKNITDLWHACNLFMFRADTYSKGNSIFLQLRDIHKSRQRQNYYAFFKALITGNTKEISYYKDLNYYPIYVLNTVYKSLFHDVNSILKNKSNITDKVEVLKKLLSTFLNDFYVSVLYQSPTDTNTEITFEATNNRNTPFTIADRFKSKMVAIINSSKPSYSHKFTVTWQKLFDKLEANPNTFSDFIKAYWEATHGPFHSNKFPKQVRDELRTVTDVKKIVNDLNHLVTTYQALINPQAYNTFKSKKIQIILCELNEMGLYQFYPLIFSMIHSKCDSQEIYCVLLSIIRIEMRRHLKGEVHTKYAQEAYEQWNNPTTAKEIVTKINDDQLYDDEKTKMYGSLYQQPYAKQGKAMRIIAYIIAKVYQSSTSNKNNDFDKSKDSIYQHIFNKGTRDMRAIKILPAAKPNNNPHKPRQINTSFDNLCNWTILEKKNIKAYISNPENPDINEMKLALSKSDLKSNKDILKLIKKNPFNNIKNREDAFINLFINAWKIPKLK